MFNAQVIKPGAHLGALFLGKAVERLPQEG